MTRIQDQELKRKALAMKISTWVVRSKRPLSLQELQHALVVRENTKKLDVNFIPPSEIILSLCAGLVVLDEERTIVRLVHYTAQEYFEREQEQWFEDPETEMTMTCATYLLFDVFRKDYNVEYRNKCRQLKRRDSELAAHPFHDFAVHYWGYHAQSATTEATQLLLRFLTSDDYIGLYRYIRMPPNRKHGDSPSLMTSGLHLAAYFGLWLLESCLLDSGNHPDEKDRNDRTALSYAAEFGQERVAKLLLARDDVDPNSSSITDPYGRRAPLMLAAKNGHQTIVGLILERSDIKIDMRDGHGNTALHWAVQSRNTSIIAQLSQKGVSLELENNPRQTVLLIAVKNGDLSMTSLLIRNGARPNPKPNEGSRSTPLALAAREGHAGVTRLLLEKGADPELRDTYRSGRYSLHGTVQGGNTSVGKLLLKEGADPHPFTGDGRTPFPFAAENGHMVVSELLLATGKVNPDSKDSEGRTPLSYAAEQGHRTIVEFLLDTCGVDPDSNATRSWLAEPTPAM
ncbi:hypothetical protein NW752_003235 [Fusarium irregulare]|uniref:GPI inositol-deacylase winged helix domain-containing protein n=1 Tax=Fusarium irregulare TaxID=2494466 RepID=A0A9W8Q2I8_9HYPO|nr:hypothetical protein NW766_000920 [Fusarium irregulare]KAJ4025759.1 hypothetical protein NW752_003235 [Fusarium irregulare]